MSRRDCRDSRPFKDLRDTDAPKIHTLTGFSVLWALHIDLMPLSLNSTVTNTPRVTSRAALPQNHICSVSILRQKSNSETVNRLHNNNYPAQKQSQLHRLQDYSLIVIVCVCVCQNVNYQQLYDLVLLSLFILHNFLFLQSSAKDWGLEFAPNSVHRTSAPQTTAAVSPGE